MELAAVQHANGGAASPAVLKLSPAQPPQHPDLSTETTTPAQAAASTVPSLPRGPQKRPPMDTGGQVAGLPNQTQKKRSRSQAPEDGSIDPVGTGPSYKATIKAKACYDITSIPNRIVQRSLDACLGTTGFRGFILRNRAILLPFGCRPWPVLNDFKN